MNKAIIHEHGRYHPIIAGRPKPDDNWPYRHYPNTPHDPEYGIKNPKFERHIFIRRDQIMFDIDAQIGMLSEARKNQDGTEDDTLTNATEKYKQMFYRWIDAHIGEAKTVMSAFVLEKFQREAMNSIKDVEEVDITLLMPEWYDDTTFPQLTNAVHNYVVTATIFDYFSVRLSSKDPVTLDKKEQKNDALTEVKYLVNAAKPNRIVKIQKPF